MFTPAAQRPWRDAWPHTAQPGDGNPWATGACWLYCRRTGVDVLWVGSVTTPGATGDVYACGPCLAELAHLVRVQAHGRDLAGDRAAEPAALAGTAHPSPVPAARARPRQPAPATARHAGPVLHSRPTGPDNAVTRAGACEHRRTEKRHGKTYCADCKRQLYL